MRVTHGDEIALARSRVGLARASKQLGRWDRAAFAARAALSAAAAAGDTTGIAAAAERLLAESRHHGAH